MITVVSTAPLPFEQVVVEELAQPFAEHNFRQDPTHHLYVGQQVSFARRREGQEEVIRFHRSIRDEPQLTATDITDEVESAPIYFGDEPYWVSRHWISVDFMADSATNSLQRNGKAGTGDDWWHFTDEQDLRRLLRELLPVILAAGQETFDDVPLETLTAA